MRVSVSNPYTDDIITLNMAPKDRITRVKYNISLKLGLYDDTGFVLIHNDTVPDTGTRLCELYPSTPLPPHIHMKMVLSVRSGFVI